MDVRVVRCDEYNLRVTTWGSGAPHAVLLPGLSADARALAPQIRALRPVVGSVHVIDLPGFALRPALYVKDATFANLARYVGRVADELGIEKATFVGHSLGGGVALHLALERPDLVEGLALLAPAALGRSLHWIYKLYCLPLIGRALLRPQQKASLPFLRHFLVGSGRAQDEHFLKMLLRHNSNSKERALSSRAIVWANQPSWWRRVMLFLTPGGEQAAFAIGDRVSSIAEVPTLVLWGNQDRVICASDARRCAEHPRAEIHVARGVGHMLPLEAPAWTNAHLRRFVAGLRQQSPVVAKADRVPEALQPSARAA
ncbi:MAG TPA: alpha/beta hydrolase [Candidatus Limnocylindrales bacterium]|nr:alpha/beta hydrolase [Candidatus Limnocylindrales bacterium]